MKLLAILVVAGAVVFFAVLTALVFLGDPEGLR